MAWQAKIRGNIEKPITALNIRVDVDYYDDLDEAKILHQRTFFFEATTTNAQMRNVVIAEGAMARAVVARAAGVASSAPDGTVIAIP